MGIYCRIMELALIGSERKCLVVQKPKTNKSRKWILTVNNPEKYGYTHDYIKEKIGQLKGVTYWCMSDEVGEQGTPHTHIYLYAPAGVEFKTLKNKMDKPDIEKARGTSEQCRNYVFKEGKWLNDAKGETNKRDTHEEWGEMPVERPGKRNDLDELYEMIEQGQTNYQIISQQPKYINQFEKLDRIRQMVVEEKYKNTFREMEVTYIWGTTGAGKTRTIMEKYGYDKVYRVTDYKHPFDQYQQQDVVVFEEFRPGSMSLTDMLNLLDGYPVVLPCRYSNKIACYTKVYILTNVELKEQYKEIQIKYPESWKAFLRRIHNIVEYRGKEIIEYGSYLRYEYGEGHITENEMMKEKEIELPDVPFIENEQMELPF